MCSNWNIENLNELDYNGMFEYLYGMKYGEKFNSEDYPNGIPKEEFESLIMEYLPITAEQIRDYAVFDEEINAINNAPNTANIPVMILHTFFFLFIALTFQFIIQIFSWLITL